MEYFFDGQLSLIVFVHISMTNSQATSSPPHHIPCIRMLDVWMLDTLKSCWSVLPQFSLVALVSNLTLVSWIKKQRQKRLGSYTVPFRGACQMLVRYLNICGIQQTYFSSVLWIKPTYSHSWLAQ